jgi:hypothetical protein
MYLKKVKRYILSGQFAMLKTNSEICEARRNSKKYHFCEILLKIGLNNGSMNANWI